MNWHAALIIYLMVGSCIALWSARYLVEQVTSGEDPEWDVLNPIAQKTALIAAMVVIIISWPYLLTPPRKQDA